MPEIRRILDQFDRAFDGDAWHGDPLMLILRDVSAPMAALRPIAGAHTIAELVPHIAHWENVVRRRIAGEAVEGMAPAENWPETRDTSETGWRAALDALRAGHQRLRRAIETFPEERLEETVPGETYTYYFMFHGVIQHTLYHAGQIAVLKKGGGTGTVNLEL